MGLLTDNLGFDDPQTTGLLSLGLRLMSTPGKFGAALGQAGLGALGDIRQAQRMMELRQAREQESKQEATRQQMMELQLAQARQAQADQERARMQEEAFRKLIPDPGFQASQAALAGGGGPTMANAQQMRPVDPQQQMLFNAMSTGQIKPMEYITATQKDRTPIQLSKDSRLLEPGTNRVLVDAVPDQSRQPSAVLEYQYAVQQGYKGTFQQFEVEKRRAGATNVNVPVNTAKPLLNTMAEGLGKQIDNNLGAARSAVDTIGGAQRIRTLLDSGQVVTGPGADWRIAARQIGSVLGVSGKNNDEVLANTRQVIQQLAQSELEAAQGMKGQGALTEAEREILRRAAAGLITYTTPELKALSTTLDERARKRIRVHNQDVDRLGQMPEGAQLVPFYRVTEPGTGSSVDDIVNRYRSR